MTILSQTILVNNETKKPFRNDIYPVGYESMETANKRQEYRKKIGHQFVNGWHVIQGNGWTEYQRYFEGAQS